MGVNHLTYSAIGLALTERFEGCRLTAYQDQIGVWTIGYGHTGPDVTEGLTITQEQADRYLAQDIDAATACVNRVVAIPLMQAQFDALVDFVFNLGGRAFERSSLLKYLNAGNLDAASAQFQPWDRAGGLVVPGLLRRRNAERDLFTTVTPS